MSANTRSPKVSLNQLFVNLAAGVKAAFLSKTTLMVGGVNLDKATLEEKLQEYTARVDKVEELRTQLSTAIRERDAAAPAAQRFAEQLVLGLRCRYGDDHNTLAKFGIYPPKPARQLSAEEKAAQVAKAVATRKHRQAQRAQAEESTPISLPGLNGAAH